MNNPLLQIVVGSTRPGRVGLPVARWAEKAAAAHGGFAVELVDLADVGLPLLDEPHHPRLGRYENDHTKAWSAIVDRADAFVFVMPEYNHGVSAALKNAIDCLNREWRHKPVGIVSYGGVAAGARAVQALEPTLVVLSMLPVMPHVNIPFVGTRVQGDGDARTFDPAPETVEGATAMFDALARTVPASQLLRDA